MIRPLAIAAFLIATGSFAANADYSRHVGYSNDFDTRLAYQKRAIEQGRQTGSITWTEGNRLRAEQREIIKTKASLESDGYLSRSDRRIINDMLDVADNHIASEASDRRQRLWWLPRVGR